MNQRRLLIAVLGFFLVVGIAMGVGGYFRMHRGPGGEWASHVFGGKITHLSATEISVADIHGTEKTFLMTPQTQIRKGKDAVTTDALSVGSIVMVGGMPAPDGHDAAREIRLLSTSTQSGRWGMDAP